MGEIANFHTLFNVISTIILFPFTGLIENLTIITIKEKNQKDDEDDDYLSVLAMLDERVSNIPSLAIINSTKVIEKMGILAEKNFRKSMELLRNFDSSQLEKFQAREDAIDRLDKEIAAFLVKLWNQDLSEQESITITSLFKIEDDYEKVGDYAYEFSKIIENMHESNLKLSEYAYNDLEKIYNIIEDAILATQQLLKEQNLNSVIEIQALKEFFSLQSQKYKNEHISRLKEGKCNVETGIAFLELLTVSEKLIDHCLNISISTLNYMTNKHFITEQEFRKDLYETNTEILKDKLNECSHKYAI